jgi:hypothetical protein
MLHIMGAVGGKEAAQEEKETSPPSYKLLKI